MAEIILDRITKKYGAFTAMKDQSLTVNEGEFLVLLGPSGCGKTTTMRLIAGLEDITAGEIRIGGKVVNKLPPKDRDIAMVFQNYGLYPHMTVRQNIEYPLKLRGQSRADRRKRAEEIAAQVELTEYLERKPAQLSGGQRQRIALARAIVRTPQLFLMDEPLSNLDAKLRVSMRAELKHLHHALGVTTVYVTHDQMEAMTLATRIAVMNKGRIEQLGTPEEIYYDPQSLFVANFIGSPAMNLIEGDLVDGTFHSGGLRVPNVAEGSRKNVVLGSRPEDITITDTDAHITAPLYAFEMTGDATLATIREGHTTICARGPAMLRREIGTPAGLHFDQARLYLFDKATEARLPTLTTPERATE